MRRTRNQEQSLRHESGTQRKPDDKSGNTLRPCAAKLRSSDERTPVPPNFACQERERETGAFQALWPSATAAATNNTSNTNNTNERTNKQQKQTNKQTNKQTTAVSSPWDSTSPMLLTCSQQGPPCGIRAPDLPLTEWVLCQLS